mgnify:FL=1
MEDYICMEKKILSLIKMHRSVRAYKSEPVLSKALDVVLEVGTYAPTGGRHQSPTIIAIIDSKYRRAIAFFGAYFKVQQLVVMTVNGLIQGCLPIMRFNYGAGNRDRLHSAFRYGTALVSGMMILGTLTVNFFPAQLLELFTASEAMRSFGISAMRIYGGKLFVLRSLYHDFHLFSGDRKSRFQHSDSIMQTTAFPCSCLIGVWTNYSN